MKIIQKKGSLIILIFLSVYIGYHFTGLIVPQPQLTFDFSNPQSDPFAAYTYHDFGSPVLFNNRGDQNYIATLSENKFGMPYEIIVTLNASKDTIECASVNGVPLSDQQIVRISDLSFSFKDTVVLRWNRWDSKFLLLFTAFSILLFTLLFWCRNEVKKSSVSKSLLIFTYSDSAYKAIGIKPILMSVLIAIVSVLIARGCDIDVIIGDLNIYHAGVDIFQLQSTYNVRNNVSLLSWPYNSTMLIFYGLFTEITHLFLPFFQVFNYHVIFYILYKIINIILINGTVLAILSFLLDKNFLEKEKAKIVYYYSIYNPLTFYIAVIFIQLDIFPAYFLTLGLLLLFCRKQFDLLPIVLLGVGVSAKMQSLLLLPIVLIVFFFGIATHVGEKFRYGGKQCGALIFCVFLFTGINYIPGTPIWHMNQYNPQTQRAWWTTITYAPVMFLYLTVFLLILFVLLNLFSIYSKIPYEMIILNGLYFIGIIVFVFSFAILSTPSTLLYSLPAFVLIYTLSKDNLQCFILAILSLLIVFEVMFTSVGDLLYLLPKFGIPFSFTILETKLAGTDTGVQLISLLFTISHTAMLSYAILFFGQAKKCIERPWKQIKNR